MSNARPRVQGTEWFNINKQDTDDGPTRLKHACQDNWQM